MPRWDLGGHVPDLLKAGPGIEIALLVEKPLARGMKLPALGLGYRAEADIVLLRPGADQEEGREGLRRREVEINRDSTIDDGRELRSPLLDLDFRRAFAPLDQGCPVVGLRVIDHYVYIMHDALQPTDAPRYRRDRPDEVGYPIQELVRDPYPVFQAQLNLVAVHLSSLDSVERMRIFGYIMLGLTADIYELLEEHVPKGTEAYAALENATPFTPEPGFEPLTADYEVECTRGDAKVFLDTAKRHFPRHVRDIELAVQRALP